MKKIILSGYVSVPEVDLEGVRRALPGHISATRAESGCIVFEVKESELESGRFDVYEEFELMAAFETHQKRIKDSEWGTVSMGATRHYTIEELDS